MKTDHTADTQSELEVIEWEYDEDGEPTIDYSAYLWMNNGDRIHVLIETGEVLEYRPQGWWYE
jgi:hypothetical protein